MEVSEYLNNVTKIIGNIAIAIDDDYTGINITYNVYNTKVEDILFNLVLKIFYFKPQYVVFCHVTLVVP